MRSILLEQIAAPSNGPAGKGGGELDNYIYFGGMRIAKVHVYPGVTYISYYLHDSLGTTRMMFDDQTGTVCYDADYFPWGGEQYLYTNTCPQNYKFTDKERDPVWNGADYFGARWLNWWMGRFFTPDWSATPTAVPYANFGNPQSLNLYSYVQNNPLTNRDLDGHASCGQAGQMANKECLAQNTVTVEQVKGQGVNGGPLGFDHAAISVNGQQAVGLEQKKDSGTAAVEDKTTPGAVKAVDPNREVKDKAVIQVTPEQAAKIQTFLNNAKQNPPNYNLYHSNCAQFCERALNAGGVKNVPNDATPHGLVEDLKGSPSMMDYIRMMPIPPIF